MGIAPGYLTVAIILAALALIAFGYGLGLKKGQWQIGGVGGALTASGLVLDAVNKGRYLTSLTHLLIFVVGGGVLLLVALASVLLQRRRRTQRSPRSSLPPSGAAVAH